MTVRIKAHFDGKVIIPDEPLNMPAGTEVTVEYAGVKPVFPVLPREQRRAALERLFKSAIPGVGLPLEALRRENIYEDDR